MSYQNFEKRGRVFCWQVLQRILMGTDVVKNVNKNNASHAVLFEALALVHTRHLVNFQTPDIHKDLFNT